MRRLVILLALLMAVVLVLSAPMAEAKKKNKKKKPPTTISCPTQSNGNCIDNSAANLLIDQANAFTNILGGEGNDTYVEYSGSSTSADSLADGSRMSSDYYYIANRNFNNRLGDALFVLDNGGTNDILDLSPARYSHFDCTPSKIAADPDRQLNDLFINCPGRDDIIVFNYYTTDSIDSFNFTDGTFPGPKNASVSSASASSAQQQQASSNLPDAGQHSGAVLNQVKEGASSADSWGATQ
jgi:hypothetical protein